MSTDNALFHALMRMTNPLTPTTRFLINEVSTMRDIPSYWDESVEAISDAFVLGDQDTFLDADYANERLVTLGIPRTERMILIEGWIVDALCWGPLR